jgi:spectinomycin phosphotransferase
MHPWNVHIDGEGDLWLIEWDEATLAPKERDLMFAIGGIGGDGVGPEQSVSFLAGYGETELDEQALAYYRAAWAVQDIASFGEEACFLLDRSEEARREAFRWLRGQFAPGCIVDMALHGPSRSR